MLTEYIFWQNKTLKTSGKELSILLKIVKLKLNRDVFFKLVKDLLKSFSNNLSYSCFLFDFNVEKRCLSDCNVFIENTNVDWSTVVYMWKCWNMYFFIKTISNSVKEYSQVTHICFVFWNLRSNCLNKHCDCDRNVYSSIFFFGTVTGMLVAFCLLLFHTGTYGFGILPGKSLNHFEITENALLNTTVHVCRALALADGTAFTFPVRYLISSKEEKKK